MLGDDFSDLLVPALGDCGKRHDHRDCGFDLRLDRGSNDSWITIGVGASGTGNGNVTYNVTANCTTRRAPAR